MSMPLRVAFAATLALSACTKTPPPPAAVPAPPGPAPSQSQAAACEGGAAPACDALAERWSSRDFARGAESERGREAASALERGCVAHAVAAACLGHAIMRKAGTATGKADPEGAKPFFGKLKALADLNGFRGEPPSPEGASALARTNADCDGGRARACGQLGWAAFNAVQREKSVKDAFASYARACELGSGNGCRWAGHFAATYPDDTGAGARADALLARGCDELENAGACDEHGSWKAKHGDASGAEGRWTRACEGGSRTGCAHLGEALLARGDAKAKDALELACAAGEDAACKKLASLPK